ncbi:uncharacterized protein PFL1_03223 [Pseudozyma flocculosa PF-1]|uniref:Related to peroxisomal targeting signal receptor n=2 Tax=Pseudozyma flocculosa TaxID=84751 RepID=A0A5C3F0E1_9BASI|nr:uncharacterized protein PFL1_03223 [Pseudozyma flocculosa PF-1]EPQ29468.1 hypothetical protein PFL1_03223 [Pseudozyma flocculosa PF-1]SPO37994.1 related to peroxisomal targeting signal receptor [Pseudozyma flocculosa]
MSLSDLVSGGAACGPSNPLQNMGKRFGQDRSTQMDTFGGAGPAASPSGSFRSAHPQHQQHQHQQQQHQQQNPAFFHAPSPLAQSQQHDPFDVAQLRGNLPFAPQQQPSVASSSSSPSSSAAFRHQAFNAPRPDFEASFRAPGPQSATPPPPLTSAATPAWAADFLKMGPAPTASAATPQQQQPQNQHRPGPTHSLMAHQMYGGPMTHHASSMQHPVHVPPGMGMGMGMGAGVGMSSFNSGAAMQQMPVHSPMAESSQAAATTVDSVQQGKWNDAFTAYDRSKTPPPPPDAAAHIEVCPAAAAQTAATHQDHSDPYERDELARTAGRLVSSVEHDQSAKFKQSNFLDLMRRIRDKQAGIQGTDIVEQGYVPGGEASVDKGKGRASEPLSDQRPQSQQEAYQWANQMASQGRAGQLPPSMQRALGQVSGAQQRSGTQPMIPPTLSADQEMANRQALNDLWAEEDARSEAIEKQAIDEQMRAFVGDAGNVAERMREDDAELNEYERYQRLGANIPHARTFGARWEEDLSRDAATTADDDDQDFVGKRWEGTKGRGVNGAQAAEWDKLQADWDDFEVTSAGMRPVAGAQGRAQGRNPYTREVKNVAQQAPPLSAQTAPDYRFLSSNPYLQSTRHHAAHTAQSMPASLESVLEREAAVAADPTNAALWFDLGVKQQENEREAQAIAALQKAIALDPSMKDAWLALAVSYTNENDRSAAYEAIERWIDTNERYREVVGAHRASLAASAQAKEQAQSRVRSDSASSHASTASLFERHAELTSLLIAMARSSPEAIDADVQVALGVLFNSSEDYAKAVDCFSSALQVRPDDWLLYNRLGATLSNSGRSDEAIGYYHHALQLQPEFVRCHFNLSISCLNLKMYQDAATHIYTALTLQQAETETLDSVGRSRSPSPSTSSAVKSGPTSGSLWETFRVSLELLNRSDLAARCAERDINLFDIADLTPPLVGGGGGGGDGGYGGPGAGSGFTGGFGEGLDYSS